MAADLQHIADPLLILLGWAGGLSVAVGVISLRQIVGPGFTWIAGGFAGLVGLGTWAIADAVWSRWALLVLVVAVVWARNRTLAGVLLVLAGAGFVADAALLGSFWPAVSLAAALGGVTGEMALAHWYLVDPRLPRSILRALAIAGIVGLILDGLVLALVGDLTRSGPTIAFAALLVTSIGLMIGVIGALRWPAYSGVMAATGLSYLAVLTTLGAVFLGRAIVGGAGPFAS